MSTPAPHTDRTDATDDPLIWLGAAELAARIRAGEVSASEATEAHIRRIEAVEPDLNALAIPLLDEAMEQAAAVDTARTRGAGGALEGVPITIKEQFRVAGTQATLGAQNKIGNVSTDEGPLVTALRSAGAIVLGKSNVMQTLAGWECENGVYGRTNNPYALTRSPGGSSGGEAALVAAGATALGLGGDLGGSIRVPAHSCGVHGFKPTSGRLTNDDFAPGLLSSGQEVFIAQPGPIARRVADLELAMTVLAATSLEPTRDLVPPVPGSSATDVAVSSMRIGMYTDNGDFPVAPAIARTLDDAADALRAMGATVESIRPPDPVEGTRLFLRAASAGGSRDISELLGDEQPIAQVAGMLRAVRAPAPLRAVLARVMDRRGQAHLARQIPHVRASSAAELFELVEARNAYRAAFAHTLDAGRYDAVLCPPMAVPAFTHGSSEHLLAAVAYSLVFNVLGVPAGVVSLSKVRPGEESTRTPSADMADITAKAVEMGSSGLPVGVQVVARHWHDHIVLAVMGALETQFVDTTDYPGPGDLVV